ncbi:hypothetical protein [Coprobacillus cateniformis]|uniref:hypothetical protein n=1 Tax=Coprobacillus cateniformis TaxID=100884 RepID=UPI0026662C51|nr:hypothetical protein [Coprobacillus cateniformis]
MERMKVLKIILGLVVLSGILIFGKDYSRSKRINVTSIQKELTFENSTIYPGKYYINKDNDIVQFEFIQMIYSSKNSDIKIIVYDQDDNELSGQMIEGNEEKNSYSDVIEKKYIVQFSLDGAESVKITFTDYDNMNSIVIDSRDFSEKKIRKKGLDYLKELQEYVQQKENLSKEIDDLNQKNQSSTSVLNTKKQQLSELEMKIKDMSDTDIVSQTLLLGTEMDEE